MHIFQKRAVGVHPKANKNTVGIPMEVIDSVPFVRIPMQMQIGPPCTAVVKKGDAVQVGQIIGEPTAPMAVPIHASVSGTVSQIINQTAPTGQKTTLVEIENDGLFTVHESVRPPQVENKDDFIAAVRASGLVGLGGAGFPTHFKLNPPPDKKIDYLLLNGMECEPYITSDDWICCAHADKIIKGVELVMHYCGIEHGIIGIESNKPKAKEALAQALAESDVKNKVKIKVVPTRYPQGAEKVLITALTGRVVPSGKLPHDVGCLVMNVGSAYYVAHYLETGMPLVRRYVTVDGSAIKQPGNFDVPIGTLISELIEKTGGFSETPHKILMGGPMMGVAVDSLDRPIIKNNNAILAFGPDLADTPQESPCIHCGRCIQACPMHLIPCMLDVAGRKRDIDKLLQLEAIDCIECGCCTYTCPAKRYLVQNIKVGKGLLRTHFAMQKAAQAARKD